jgi:hypothetical protein
MKVRFTSVGDEFLQPLFFTSQSLHPRSVFQIFSVCVDSNIVTKNATTNTEKVSNTNRGCRLWDVKNSGYKNTTPTEVKRPLFIKICQILYRKVCEISVKPKNVYKTSAPTSQFWKFFILNLCLFHFHFVAIILHLWLMKFYKPEKWTYCTR